MLLKSHVDGSSFAYISIAHVWSVDFVYKLQGEACRLNVCFFNPPQSFNRCLLWDDNDTVGYNLFNEQILEFG